MPTIPSGAAGQTAQQTIKASGTVSGGSFTIEKLDGQVTQPIAWNATGDEVAKAINNALGGQAPAITGTGAAGGPWVITIPLNLIEPLNANVPFTINNTAITGGGTLVAEVTREGLIGGDALKGSGRSTSEAPHIVGTTGNAAYENGFESPVGKSVTVKFPAAAPADANLTPAQYYLDTDGYVHLLGVAVPTGAVAAGKSIFKLPEAYRPFQDENLGAVTVKANGEVVINVAVTATGEAVNMSDLTFRVAGV